MRIRKSLIKVGALLALLSSAALADHVTVDYDHNTAFTNYHTFSWGKVETANSIWDSRVKDTIGRQLQTQGWREVASGGDVTLVATETTHTKPEVNTFYNGFGGRRFGGFGNATTTVENYKIGTLVVDMYDASSKNMIWRAASSSALSGNPEKNTKTLDKDVQKMFDHFPPSTNKG